MSIIFLLILSLICIATFAEICAFLLLKKQSRSTKPLFIDREAFKQSRSFRAQALAQLFKHYMAHDSSLGFRIKANAAPFRFASRLKSKKFNSVKQLNLKNLFEISTDKYGFISNKKNQERDYLKIIQDPKIYRILVSGNSVSAGSGTSCSEANWPSILEEILNSDKNFLKEKYEEVVVINSSSLGNNLTQEITKFQNETIYLKPHLVISFSGLVANYNYRGNPLDDLHSEQQKKVNDCLNISWFYRQNFFLQNLKSYLVSTKYFNEHLSNFYPYRNKNYIEMSAAELFISKIKQFKGICDSHKINFIFIFQPAMGSGEKVLTEYEEFSKKFFKRYFFGAEWEDYLKVFNQYADHVRKNLTEKYQHDFMDIFKDVKETVYSDPRHIDDNGHKIVAQKISELVTKEGN
jgi:hypothetical protein